MTLIERAARAICAVAGNPKRSPPGVIPDLDRDYNDVDWERYEDHARAVLEAIREPSEGMIGTLWPDDEGSHMLRPTDKKRVAAEGWRMMIDAALVEGA